MQAGSVPCCGPCSARLFVSSMLPHAQVALRRSWSAHVCLHLAYLGSLALASVQALMCKKLGTIF